MSCAFSQGLKNAFIQEAAKRKLDRLLLTAAVSAAPKTIRRAYQVRNIARFVLLFVYFINILLLSVKKDGCDTQNGCSESLALCLLHI